MLRHHLREILFGPPLPSADMEGKRLDKLRALAALSPDALASVAYANQEIYLGLVVAGAAALAYSWSIALVIAGLLIILTLSYSQTISAYPSGGGSYTVARENLGTTVGLVAASALMIDYVLNAAVSLTAGVEALASAFPIFWPHRMVISLVLLAVITLVNLRGMKEAGSVMIIPVYLFIFTYIAMIIFGLITALREGPGALIVSAPPAVESLTIFLILRTFASGATALTGVEAISNAVPVFQSPSTRNARQTMRIMAILMAILFLGTIGLTQYLAVTPGVDETILSALARRLFGSGFLYFVLQLATLLVLVVAANTSFTGFPRVASILARDGFLPHQLRLIGDRLVYSNGIILLSMLAGLLIIIFEGDTHSLIPLFAVGAFLAFTLSQAGMVIHWIKLKGTHWLMKASMNGLGALATSAALIVIVASKFIHGAWIVILLIPLFVLMFRAIEHHYQDVRRQLTLEGTMAPVVTLPHPRVVVPVASVHRGVLEALTYARSISDNITAVHVETEPESGERLREKWAEYHLDQIAALVIIPSEYRHYIGPFLNFLDDFDQEADDGRLATVLVPEFVPARWWQYFLHNQTAWLLKISLLYRRRTLGKIRAIVDIPFNLSD